MTLYDKLFFDNTFVINRSKDKTRMKIITSQLNILNIKFHRFEACTSNLYNISLKYKNIPKGAIGVANSHYGLWKKQVNENIKRMTILEDDAEFHPNFHEEFVNSYLQLYKIDKNWDIILYGTNFPCNDNSTKLAKYLLSKFQDQKKNNKISKRLYRAYTIVGTQGYSLTLNAAKFLLKHYDTIYASIDVDMGRLACKYNNFKVYIIDHPQLIIQKTKLFVSTYMNSGQPFLFNYFFDKIDLHYLLSLKKNDFESYFSLAYALNYPLHPKNPITGINIFIFIFFFILGLTDLILALLFLFILIVTDLVVSNNINSINTFLALIAIILGSIITYKRSRKYNIFI